VPNLPNDTRGHVPAVLYPPHFLCVCGDRWVVAAAGRLSKSCGIRSHTFYLFPNESPLGPAILSSASCPASHRSSQTPSATVCSRSPVNSANSLRNSLLLWVTDAIFVARCLTWRRLCVLSASRLSRSRRISNSLDVLGGIICQIQY
jgi:hypothetical protein